MPPTGNHPPMNWNTSTRGKRLPGDWKQLRQATLHRDAHQCVSPLRDGGRCPEPATDVDHITRGDNHALENLQSLCAWHHKRKTQQEAQAARAALPRVTEKRPTGKHPGLV
jgi:5-methylcytosine-specific restriction enzyme A